MSAEAESEKGSAPLTRESDPPEYVGEQNFNRNAAQRFGTFAPIMEKLFDYGLEIRGVERVLEVERDPKLLWNK